MGDEQGEGTDRSRAVPGPSGADHASQHLPAVRADVASGADALLAHHPAVQDHPGRRLADGHVKLWGTGGRDEKMRGDGTGEVR